MLIVHSSENLYSARCEIFRLRILPIRKHKDMINCNTSVFQFVMILLGQGLVQSSELPAVTNSRSLLDSSDLSMSYIPSLQPRNYSNSFFFCDCLRYADEKQSLKTIFKEELINSLRVLVLPTQPLATSALKELSLSMGM